MTASVMASARRAGLAALVAALTLITAPVVAHTPTIGGSRGSLSGATLLYKFAGSYPSWVTTAVNGEFQTYYADATWNNSLAPLLDFASTGTAIVTYSSSGTSPCSGSTSWLACAQNGGTSAFRIYLRNLVAAPHPNDWGWYEDDNSCTNDSVCFYTKRSLLHELGHAVFSFGHDGQGEDDTVMGTNQPWASNTGWSRRVWQRCDQAAAQLLWGARNVAGPIAECMDHVAGAGSNGLLTVVTLSAAPSTACLNEVVTLSGSLHIATNTNYNRLSGDALGSRVVTIKRDSVTWVTRTTGSTSGNYSATASFSTAGSRAYVTSFPNERTDALTGDSSSTVTVTWSTQC